MKALLCEGHRYFGANILWRLLDVARVDLVAAGALPGLLLCAKSDESEIGRDAHHFALEHQAMIVLKNLVVSNKLEMVTIPALIEQFAADPRFLDNALALIDAGFVAQFLARVLAGSSEPSTSRISNRYDIEVSAILLAWGLALSSEDAREQIEGACRGEQSHMAVQIMAGLDLLREACV